MKTFIKRCILFLLLLAMVPVTMLTGWRNVLSESEKPSTPMHQEAFQTRFEEFSRPSPHRKHSFKPVRICIPAVRLSAKVVPVGLQPDGRLGVPKSSEVAGYYEDGIKPGEPGNALIAGHVDDYKGPGIFYPLKKVKPGSFVLLFDAKNDVLVYRVEQNESYFTQDAPLDRIFGDTNEYRLNLITCTGIYNRNKKEHEQRLVVYTQLVQ
ncbi:class F sortase [Paenibacillus silvae]|uniref:class F sortase n=2 Tax=Paenibacillus silvae TaxID=1325358 RepID=UPI0011A6CC18|nr:class F sortase [Paenibacillus silvae]MCK6078131.1 class F sortase [Paenibacillus silvae]MCK6152473.1 class F sortase [Paenibacillus silvae]MCK6271131.1 class F sortase [Paenibacillus silvae]